MTPIAGTPKKKRNIWKIAGLVVLWLVVTVTTLVSWLGLTYWLNQDPAHPVAADVVFNYLSVFLVTFVGLPVFHRAILRRGWHREKRRIAGMRDSDAEAEMNTSGTDPLPYTRKTWQQWVLYVAFYLYGFAFLVLIFGPLGNQVRLIRFIARYSAGTASFGSLMNLVILVPAGLMLLLLFFVLDRERDAIERGELDPAETLRLRLKQEWLFSFVTALATTAFLCFFIGRMTAAHLS
jgi:hypothetical protein